MSDPQALNDRRAAARHLLTRPLTCAEHDPDMFTLIRRHETELDRWFTQRLGYRLHLTADTARLFKSTAVPDRRPLLTATSDPRPFTKLEYTQLALILAAVAAGPRVTSLKNLVDEIRSAATDAGVQLTDEARERRAVVTALNWMVSQGLARELHERVERYAADGGADAVIEVFPDRIALVPLPALSHAETAAEVLQRDEQVNASRQWMRAKLVEDPVLYRWDVSDDQWREIRRRLGEEAGLLEEMFDLVLESRAEGMAAIDPSGELTDRRFPTTRTVGHAALTLLERLTTDNQVASAVVDTSGTATHAEHQPSPSESGGDQAVPDPAVPEAEGPVQEKPSWTAGPVVSHQVIVDTLTELAATHRRIWSKEAEDASRLARKVIPLLVDHRLLEQTLEGLRVLPLAYRYAVAGPDEDTTGTATGAGTEARPGGRESGGTGAAGNGSRAKAPAQDQLW